METNISNSNLSINKLKRNFLLNREIIKKEFLVKNKALLCCKKNSKNMDNLICDIFNILKSKNKQLNDQVSICAVGGYGRQMLAPHSDIDILFLYHEGFFEKELNAFIQNFLYPLWDLGLKIGYAVRSVEEAKYFFKTDHVVQTSMLEARLISGNKKLYSKVLEDFKKEIKRTGFNLIKEKINERKTRIVEMGYDYFKNEPNLKENAGSIRDINLIFWILSIYEIHNSSHSDFFTEFLTIKEKKKLKSSLEFLLLLRCHLHYQSGRLNDVLSFDYQFTISKKIFSFLRYDNNENKNIFVEKLMKEYFFQIRNIKNLTEIFSQMLEKLLKSKLKNIEFKVSNNKPSIYFSSYLKKLAFSEDNAFGRRIILESIDKLDKKKVLTKTNLTSFKKILFSKKKDKLTLLFDLGLLSIIIPEFSYISFLPQFDRFHSLSVGQHTLKAVNILKDLEEKKIRKKQYKFFYEEYKKKFNKRALYYATLLHDIGKGKGGEHNKKGADIAKKIVSRFQENEETLNDTHWLVYNHSLLSNYAFKKDLEDHSVIVKLCEKIQKIPRLRALFFLTVTDISAVDQGLWNNWKSNLLRQLFLKLEHQIKSPKKVVSLNEKIQQIRSNILEHSKKISKRNLDKISKITYPSYWLLQSEKMIIYQIEHFLLNRKNKFNFIVRKSDDKSFYELIIFTKDKHHLFLNLISIFVLEEISIFEARIFTLDDGTVIDTFKFSFDERKNFNEIDVNRVIRSIELKLECLKNGKTFEIRNFHNKRVKLLNIRADVNIDNESSATYTILNVRTNNRPQLLYDISKILIQNKIIISMAKISTYGDFVEDSFHLRSEYGLKINNTNAVDKLVSEIKNKLLFRLNDVV